MPPPARRHRPVASRLARLLAPLLPLFAGWLATPPRARADDLTLALNRPHPFAGLGVEIWPGSDHVAERDALMAALHVRFVRVGLGWKLPASAFEGDRSVAALRARIAAAANPHADARVRALGLEMRRAGIAVHGVFWSMPDAWKTPLAPWRGMTRFQAQPSHLQDYANWIAAQLLAARDLGLVPQAIELTNEPNGAWNERISPADYDALVVRTRGTLDREGLSEIGIEGPGTSQIYQMAPYLEALFDSGTIRQLSAVTMHDYDTIKLPEPAGLAGLPPALLARIPPKPIFVTEFSSAAPRWNRPPYDAGPGQPPGKRTATDSDAFGAAVAGEALRLISDGANAVFNWQLQDPPWAKVSNGLLDGSGRRRPAAAALLAAFGAVPPGASAIPVRGASPGLGAVGFRSGTELIVDLANLENSPRPVRITGLAAAGGSQVIAAFPEPPPAGGLHKGSTSIELMMPANSVVCLRLH